MVNTRTPEQHQGRILFVEADPDTSDLVDCLLAAAGFEMHVAATLAEGLQHAQQKHCNLILLDSYFEDGTGLELCQAIRAFDPLTPIFFYTGQATEQEIKALLQAGAQGCFIKPVDGEQLVTTIAQCLQKQNQCAAATAFYNADH